MSVRYCWPTHWIEAAKKARLAYESDPITGQFFIVGGDSMRASLELFGEALQDAEREACAKTCRAVAEECLNWDDDGVIGSIGAGQCEQAIRARSQS